MKVKKTPQVTVIIPTFRRPQFLGRAIESVLRQTFFDYELIIVDDGSTDNTKEVIKPFLTKIRYFYKDNEQPYHKKNLSWHG